MWKYTGKWGLDFKELFVLYAFKVYTQCPIICIETVENKTQYNFMQYACTYNIICI